MKRLVPISSLNLNLACTSLGEIPSVNELGKIFNTFTFLVNIKLNLELNLLGHNEK